MSTVLITVLMTCSSSKDIDALENKQSLDNTDMQINKLRAIPQVKTITICSLFVRVESQYIKNISSKRLCVYGNIKRNTTTTLDHLTSEPANSYKNR
jgi:hypothetical protein